jgi:hypothetical protein
LFADSQTGLIPAFNGHQKSAPGIYTRTAPPPVRGMALKRIQMALELCESQDGFKPIFYAVCGLFWNK